MTGDDNVTPLHHAARYRREKKKKEASPDTDAFDDDVSIVISRLNINFCSHKADPIIALAQTNFYSFQITVSRPCWSHAAWFSLRDHAIELDFKWNVSVYIGIFSFRSLSET